MKTLTKILLIAGGLILGENNFAYSQVGQYSDSYWKGKNQLRNKYAQKLIEKEKQEKEAREKSKTKKIPESKPSVSDKTYQAPERNWLDKHSPDIRTNETVTQDDYPFKCHTVDIGQIVNGSVVSKYYVVDVPDGEHIIIAPAKNEYIRIKLKSMLGDGNEIDWLKPYVFRKLYNSKGELVTSLSIDNLFTGPAEAKGDLTEQNYPRQYRILWINTRTGDVKETEETARLGDKLTPPDSKKDKKKNKKKNKDSDEDEINLDDWVPHLTFEAKEGLPGNEEALPIYLLKWDENLIQYLPPENDGKTRINLENSSGVLYAPKTTQEYINSLYSSRENAKDAPAKFALQASAVDTSGKSLEKKIDGSKIKPQVKSESAKKTEADKISKEFKNSTQNFYVKPKSMDWEKLADKLRIGVDSLKKYSKGDTVNLNKFGIIFYPKDKKFKINDKQKYFKQKVIKGS